MIKKEIQVAYPFFPKKDIRFIQSQIPKILNGKLSTGPFTKEFESLFAKTIGTKYAIFLNSCTSALEISLSYLKLKKGDEVIVPTQSFVADGSAVITNNGKPVFANINYKTFCLDFKEIQKKTTRKTKAIILLHFGGYMPFDIKKIIKFCKKNKIYIIEDCAHAIGSKINNLSAGNIGIAGCFSFFSTKTITTAEGGMITTNNKKFYNYAVSMRTRGNIEDMSIELYDKIGRNCRPTEISALLGLTQLKNIKKINKHRLKVVKIYNNYIFKSKNISSLEIKKNSNLSIWKYVAVIENKKILREKLRSLLKLKYNININWAYTPLLHKQPVFEKLLSNKDLKYLKKTEELCDRHFHLPLHTLVSIQEAKYIIKSLDLAINEILKND